MEPISLTLVLCVLARCFARDVHWLSSMFREVRSIAGAPGSGASTPLEAEQEAVSTSQSSAHLFGRASPLFLCCFFWRGGVRWGRGGGEQGVPNASKNAMRQEVLRGAGADSALDVFLPRMFVSNTPDACAQGDEARDCAYRRPLPPVSWHRLESPCREGGGQGWGDEGMYTPPGTGC